MVLTNDSDLNKLVMMQMGPADPLLNYCQWDYRSALPSVGKLRASSLLFLACSMMPNSRDLAETVLAVQHVIGEYRGVFGVKWDGTGLEIEIYIYDYARERRLFSLEHVTRFSNGVLSTPVQIPKTVPYFMFSFDLTPELIESGGLIDRVHVYIGNPGSNVSSGISYLYTCKEICKENVYFFFDSYEEVDSIRGKLSCSLSSKGTNNSFYSLYLPYMDPSFCATVCVANKRYTDTLYLSGVPVHYLLKMLKEYDWPAPFPRFVSQQIDMLGHLHYDIGFDYSLRANPLSVARTAFFSSF
jgi:hypothetical protein